jgi:tetrapyrrole methylase family protein/MazG family protein
LNSPASATPDENLPPPERPIERLLAIMQRLRSPNGCPWDREQTLQSLKPYLVEECYEVLDAIDEGDPEKHAEELGDLLLQIVFQAQIRSERGEFRFDDVARAISEKLIRRHPHVFGDVKADTPEAVVKNWEAIKRTEKEGAPRSAVAGIPRHLPALQKAEQVQIRAARVGFDWDQAHQVVDKIEEEVREVKEAMVSGARDKIREEIGDLLFAVVNLSRFLGYNAEETLNQTVGKFVRRFQAIEQRVHKQGRKLSDCSLSEMDKIWSDIKREEHLDSP